MGSFTCPHMKVKERYCMRLKAECVPGRPGCIIPDDTNFNVGWEERLEKRRKLKKDDPAKEFQG
ncbi:MAG: hypothetical protein ABEK50_00925 [bacterium]